MIWFTPKATKYERSPSQTSLNTWNVSHIVSDTYSWKFSVYAANIYTLIYVRRGIFDFACFHKKEQINENDLLCIAPSQSFCIRNIKNSECELYIVEFDCNNFPFFNLSNYLLTNTHQIDENMFRELENIYISKENDYIIDSYLIQILNNIRKGLSQKNDQSILVGKIRSYVREHAHEKLTASHIADVFGYNKDYLVRILQKSENTSLKNLIIEEKLRIVKNLLSFTDYPISKVGERIGFDDPNDFHKFFKYHMHMTPSAYRISRIR